MTGFAKLAAARRSVRAFRPDPLPRARIEALLTTARTAPSGANLQPGRFTVLAGTALEALKTALVTASLSGRRPVSDYGWFPDPMPEALKTRQRAAGYALYQALGIDRRDLEGRAKQFRANYRFFDAPVGIVVSMDRGFGPGGFLDLGMCLQTLLLAAEDEGLAACGIGALANHADVIQETLRLPASEMVICGVALGYPDPDAPVNHYRTAREPVASFAEFRGFDSLA
ncbi:MAG: nitroreductase [Pseudorhodobacter sp.]|nr:nitroreductase [Pseudorhodobacter sp.]